MAVPGLWNEGLLWEGSSAEIAQSYVYTLWIYYWNSQEGLTFGWREREREGDEYSVAVIGLLKWLRSTVPWMEAIGVCHYTKMDESMYALFCHNCTEQAVNQELWYPQGRKVAFLKNSFRGDNSKLLCVLNYWLIKSELAWGGTSIFFLVNIFIIKPSITWLFYSACLQHNASCQEHDWVLEVSFKPTHVCSMKLLS